MTTATRKSISSQTREELEEINEDEPNKQSTININNNTIALESTNVHQDTTSRISPKHQRATNTTLRNEYVSYLNEQTSNHVLFEEIFR
jgi:hypothetical protein